MTDIMWPEKTNGVTKTTASNAEGLSDSNALVRHKADQCPYCEYVAEGPIELGHHIFRAHDPAGRGVTK